MNKAVFLDRDGTINVDYGYVYQYEKIEYIDGVKEALKRFMDIGYILIIITNQSGVARGFFDEKAVKDLHEKMCMDLERFGIVISGIYYCPHLKGCNCRKPDTGLFYRAVREHNIDFSESIAVGDKIRDLSICEKEPVRGFLISGDINIDIKNERIKRVNDMREIFNYL